MSRPCICDRCGIEPWGQYLDGECRLCWLYHHDPEYKAHWDSERRKEEGGGLNSSFLLPTSSFRRSLPCIHLGEVLDRRGCHCPLLWLRGCYLHGPITIQTCKTCPDYEEDA